MPINLSLSDLASNDSTNSANNPFYREFMQGQTSALVSSDSYAVKKNTASYDNYASTSILSLSQVMEGSPISNNPQQVIGTQSSLLTSLLQQGLSAVKGTLGIFDFLLPSDVQAAAGTQKSAQTNSNTNGAVNSSPNSSNVSAIAAAGLPTTNTAPGGLPAGYKALPNTGIPVAEFVNVAFQQVGKPYVWGATGPAGFDCSGLILYSLAQLKIIFPHYTGDQYNTIVKAGLNISVAEAANIYGALLFIGSPGSPASDHVAISLGNNNQTLQAPHTGANVFVTGGATQGYDVGGLIPGLDYSQVTYGQGLSTIPATSK